MKYRPGRYDSDNQFFPGFYLDVSAHRERGSRRWNKFRWRVPKTLAMRMALKILLRRLKQKRN